MSASADQYVRGTVLIGREGVKDIYTDEHLKDTWIPRYRMRPLGDHYLLTSDHGSWLIIDQEELNQLRSITLSNTLFKRLEENGLILTSDNASKITDSWKQWCSNYYTGTSLHIIGVTRRCNLKCLYCHAVVVPDTAKKQRYDMSPEVGLKVVDFAYQSPSPMLHFEFQGGEATLNPELIKSVYEYACVKNIGHKRKLSFSLVTNLVDVPYDILEFCKKSGIGITTTAELSGKESEHFRIDYQEKSTQKRVVAAQAKLQAKGYSVPSLMVIAKNNLHRMREYVDFAVANGMDSVFLSPVQKLGFARKNWDQVGVSMDEYLDAWRDAQEYIHTLWDQGIFIIERQFSLALQKMMRDKDVRYMDFRNPNGSVLGNLAYDQSGNIFACDEGRANASFKLGNVHDDSYNNIVTSSRSRKIMAYSLRELPECQQCAYKPYCGVHPIVSLAETGDPLPKPLTDSSCQLTLGIFDYIFELQNTRPKRIAQAIYICEEQ